MRKIFQVVSMIVFLLILMIAPGGEVGAQTRFRYRYVVPGGSTSSEYCTRYDPCDLRYAIDTIADAGDVLVVHSGTYYSELMAIDLIFIDKSLTLWGSCEFDASTPFQCFPEEHNSILDAETNKRVVRIQGTGIEEVTIDGFTIMRGSGVTMMPCIASFDGCGAGIHATNLAELTLKNNYFWQSKAGGTSGIGGALFADSIDFFKAEKNTFIANQATETGLGGGGGAFVSNSGGPHAVQFTQNLFYNNEVSTESGLNHGGAGLLITESNNVQIKDNQFLYQNYNQQITDIDGSALYLSYNTGVSVEGNNFKNGYGGSAVYISGTSETLGMVTRNKWWNNLGYYNLHFQGPVTAVVINNFLGRQVLSSLSRGGASTSIYTEGDELSGSNNIAILFNTFAATDFGVSIGQYSDVEILSNIFTGLRDAITLSTTHVSTVIDNNLFFGNSSYTILGSNYVYEDPKLADIGSGDFHLLPGSGAINRSIGGDFDIDIDGQSRPSGTGPTPYDLGADEYHCLIYLPFIRK